MMPETLHTTFLRWASRPISAFQRQRSLDRILALPQWSRMNEVSGQASTNLTASPSSFGPSCRDRSSILTCRAGGCRR